ncbi:MAG TPA: hypothetical protein VFC76_05985 [Oscillospiraceae bacterium]|nr:hypothetical protein [Oscillospiraceae bacterium]
MKYRDNLKAKLGLYTVDDAPICVISEMKKSVTGTNFIIIEPRLLVKPLLKGQLKNIRPSFWLCCLAYMIIITAVSFFAQSSQTLITIAAITPFLSVAAMPSLFYYSAPMYMELEQSCLFKPKTTLAAKVFLCGVTDLLTVLIASAICAVFGDAQFLRCLVFAFISFFASAFFTLGASLFLRAQTAIFLSAALFVAFMGLIFGSDSVKTFMLLSRSFILLLGVFIFALLVAAVITITFRKYDFERTGLKIGNHI